MQRLTMQLFLILSCMLVATLSIRPEQVPDNDAKNSWFQDISLGKETTVKLKLYVQDLQPGALAPTVYPVANASITSISPSSFGSVQVVDDLITAEPNALSLPIGRLQGLITASDLAVPALAMNLNFYFTAPPYTGSTISIIGRNPLLELLREVAIVGGTGVFRYARGYATVSTRSFDPISHYAVLEYTLYATYGSASALQADM